MKDSIGNEMKIEKIRAKPHDRVRLWKCRWKKIGDNERYWLFEYKSKKEAIK